MWSWTYIIHIGMFSSSMSASSLEQPKHLLWRRDIFFDNSFNID